MFHLNDRYSSFSTYSKEVNLTTVPLNESVNSFSPEMETTRDNLKKPFTQLNGKINNLIKQLSNKGLFLNDTN